MKYLLFTFFVCFVGPILLGITVFITNKDEVLYSYYIEEPMIVTDYSVCKHTRVDLKGLNTGHLLNTSNYHYKEFNLDINSVINRTYKWTATKRTNILGVDTFYTFNIDLSDLEKK